MSLLSGLRAKGYDAHLQPDLTVVLKVTGQTNLETATKWVKANEQQLRLELVGELQSIAMVQGCFPDGKLRKFRRTSGGSEIRGAVVVQVKSEPHKRAGLDTA